jgi:hypothetical protein
MPQLDKLIFFMENIGFVLSFFFMVFYNQYVFYPKLLKNIYVRRFFILKFNLTKLFNTFYNLFNLYNTFKQNKIQQLVSIFLTYINDFFFKLNFFFNLKKKLIFNYARLLISKFKLLFVNFYAIYRSYIIELDFH